MSSKRPRCESETPYGKKRRHSSEGLFRCNLFSPDTHARKSSQGNQGSFRSNPVSPCALSSSTGSRRSKRIQALGSPDYTDTYKRKIKVQPLDFVCLFDKYEPEIPKYIRKGKKNSPILWTSVQVSSFIRASFNDEQKKRLQCLSDCMEAMLKGVKLQFTTWEDTTSNLSDRKNSMAIIKEKYGHKEDQNISLIFSFLSVIYYALIKGFDHGNARGAMNSIFLLPHMVLKGDFSFELVDNLGGSSSLIEANSHFIKVTCDLDDFDKEAAREMIVELMSGEEIQGSYQQATPDVAMFTIDNDTKVGGIPRKKWYLLGECKSKTSLISSHFLGQVFRQCLCGLNYYNPVYGCGLTYNGAFLTKIEMRPDDNENDVWQEYFHFNDKKNQNFFDCSKFSDFIICLSEIVQLNELEFSE